MRWATFDEIQVEAVHVDCLVDFDWELCLFRELVEVVVFFDCDFEVFTAVGWG